MSGQRLEFAPIFQTDQIIRGDGFLDRNGRRWRLIRLDWLRIIQAGKASMHRTDEIREGSGGNLIVGNIGGDDVDGQIEQICVFLRHVQSLSFCVMSK